jgi:putative endonuclease
MEKRYFIYVLVFEDNAIYVGMTSNFGRRIRAHKRGSTRSTKGKSLSKVLKLEECTDSIQAREREKFWKSGQGREKIRQFLQSGVEQSGSSSGS